jgi:hypothetical protein
MPKEVISHEAGNDEAWICVCGNQGDGHGFFPCNTDGNEVEPTATKWTNLYACGRCGRIIKQGTLEVIGRNPTPKMLA